MSITYNGLVSEVANLTVITSNTLINGDTNFPTGIVGGAIDYAEGRLYRDLDLPAVRVTDTSVALSSGVRTVSLSTTQGELLALESFCVSSSTAASATRTPLVAASLGVINTIYPSASSSNCGTPEFFARVSNTQIVFGPTPDIGYATEVIATTRPNPLSALNSSTWLTQNLPELMVAGCMVFMSGYMRDSTQGPYWESQYQMLMKSANVDSLRMKFQSAGWSAQVPSPLATPRT